MKSGGIGVGSASIVLVFAVLCLTVFSLITYVVAGNSKALTDSEANFVTGYYKADALAESIVAQIMENGSIPDNACGIDITSDLDSGTGAETASFICPISDLKELYVCIAVYEDSYEILSWRMFDIGKWAVDDSIEVWQGPDEVDIGDPMAAWSGLDQMMD